ncbi:MAG: threonine ammonia-lyase [Ignisphaera sp.]
MTNILEAIWNHIIDAEKIVYKVVHRTPLDFSTTFSKISGNKVYLKLENMQKTGSFKVRGAFYKIYKHLDEAKAKGVVTASSGNHAQAVAFAASSLGVKSTVVMPETAPVFKINAAKNYGANVILYGRLYDDAYRKALEIAEENKMIFVHPFDDPEVIGGQGTIGLEILNQLNDVDFVFVPIGGGGLISGIGVAIKNVKPDIKIVGVEPKNAPKYYLTHSYGKIIELDPKPSLADGVVTKRVGNITFEVMEDVVDDIVVVDEDSIARAIYLLMERSKIVVEGAGALPLAALLEGYVQGENKNVVLVLSGGNIDLTTLYRVVLRGLAAEGRISTIKLILKDTPGELLKVLNILHKYRCNIIDVRHDRYSLEIPVGYALVELIFEAPERSVINEVKKELEALSIQIID